MQLSFSINIYKVIFISTLVFSLPLGQGEREDALRQGQGQLPEKRHLGSVDVTNSFSGIQQHHIPIEEVYCKRGGRLETFRVPETPFTDIPKPDLVIANGGGGQAGMIEFLARTFLQTMERDGVCVAWHASNTDGSHKALKNGNADLAVVYDAEKIKRAALKKEIAPEAHHIWMDRFALVGPTSKSHLINPSLSSEDAIRNIMKTDGAFWLTRVDKSTAHQREAHLFAQVVGKIRKEFGLDPLPEQQLLNLLTFEGFSGMPDNLKVESKYQLAPWETRHVQLQLVKDKASPRFAEYRQVVREGFYRPLNLLPKQATRKANELGYFTLSDHGIFNSLDPQDKINLKIMLDGKEQLVAENEFFLNPAYAIESLKSTPNPLAKHFLSFLTRQETKEIVPSFTGRASLDMDPMSTPKASTASEEAKSLFEKPSATYQERIDSLLTVIRTRSYETATEAVASLRGVLKGMAHL